MSDNSGLYCVSCIFNGLYKMFYGPYMKYRWRRTYICDLNEINFGPKIEKKPWTI